MGRLSFVWRHVAARRVAGPRHTSCFSYAERDDTNINLSPKCSTAPKYGGRGEPLLFGQLDKMIGRPLADLAPLSISLSADQPIDLSIDNFLVNGRGTDQFYFLQ